MTGPHVHEWIEVGQDWDMDRKRCQCGAILWGPSHTRTQYYRQAHQRRDLMATIDRFAYFAAHVVILVAVVYLLAVIIAIAWTSS
jgi:hypothetical protein